MFDALPPIVGQTVLDLGCSVGDQTKELVARGADVIGFDVNEDLLMEARSKELAGAEFRQADFRTLPELATPADGLWCIFTAAHFPDRPEVLALWKGNQRSGGWIAVMEIDNLLGHGPLGNRSRSLLEGYAREALIACRYDFFKGRRLVSHFERSGFTVVKSFIVADQELCFDGPAQDGVVVAWRARFDRMKYLQALCGSAFDQVQEEFLRCLKRPDHWTETKVYACIATT
jgi:SAM-dependent methyltransferase